MPIRRRVAAVLIACAAAAGGAHEAAAKPLSAEELFRGSVLTEAGLSPSGRYLGTIITDEDDMKNLLIFDLRTNDALGLRATQFFEISNFLWMREESIVFNVTQDKVYSHGLYAADIHRLDRSQAINRYDVTEIIGMPQDRPDRVLLWIKQGHGTLDGKPRLVELNTRDNAYSEDPVVQTFREPADGPVISWATNRKGELALCTTWSNGGYHLHRYHPESRSWADVPLPLLTRAMDLDYDPNLLWVVTVSPRKAYELRRMNLTTGEMEAPVLTDPAYDIGAGTLFFSGVERRMVGVVYLQQKLASVWFSKTYATAQAIMNKLSPGTDNLLFDSDAAERRFLFQLAGSSQPESYKLLDLDTKRLTGIADANPALRGRPLCRVEPANFATRDGVTLEEYRGLPAGADARHPVPLVVLVHGGPWVRDNPSFNPVVQFLVSRGYAVIQPQYRGSTGYSPEISHEDEYDFMRMHNDVTDATRAMIASGIVDPRRVAIMGASFGGYLAVAGVAFEDGLYRCAITECGVFDWESQIKSKSSGGRPGEYEMLLGTIGRPGIDHKHLQEISPLEHADRIHVPVLIAHGTDDNVVDVAQSKRLARELRKRGVPYETFYRSLEGHGFYSYKDRVDFYHRVEAFLAANLGGATLTRVD